MMIDDDPLPTKSKPKNKKQKEEVEQKPKAKSKQQNNDRFIEEKEISHETDLSKIKTRKNFSPLAHYSFSVITNEFGTIDVPVDLPDNLTRYRIFAVASSINTKEFGVGESAITVQLPLTIRPFAPTFLYIGDTSSISFTIQNLTEKNLFLKFGATVKNKFISFVNEEEEFNSIGKEFELLAGKKKILHFTIRSKYPGNEVINFICTSGKFADSSVIPITISPILFKESKIISGYLMDKANNHFIQSFKIPPNYFPNIGKLNINVGTSFISKIAPIINNSISLYCSVNREDICSFIMIYSNLIGPTIALQKDRDHQLPFPILNENRIVSMISYLYRYRFFVDYSIYLKLFSIFTISIAAKTSYFQSQQSKLNDQLKINIRTFNHIIYKYLTPIIPPFNKRISSDEREHHQILLNDYYFCFTNFLLNHVNPHNKYRKNIRNFLKLKYFDEISLECYGYILSILDTIKDQDLILNIVNYLHTYFSITDKKNNIGILDTSFPYSISHMIFYSPIRANAIIAFGLLNVDKKNDMIGPIINMLMNRMGNGRWNNTQEDCWCTLVISEYFNLNLSSDNSILLWLDDHFCGEFPLSANQNKSFSFPLHLLSSSNKFNINNDNNNIDNNDIQFKGEIIDQKEGEKEHKVIILSKRSSPIFYSISFDFACSETKIPRIFNGFSISKYYSSPSSEFNPNNNNNNNNIIVSEDGKEYEFKVGEIVEISLIIQNYQDSNNVVIKDFIPGCFLIENPFFSKPTHSSANQNVNNNIQSMERNYFDDLPLELLIEIFQYFSPKELCKMQLVCRNWKFVSSNDYLWNKFISGFSLENREWWMSSKDIYLLQFNYEIEELNRRFNERSKIVIEDEENSWISHENIRSELIEVFAERMAPSTYIYKYKVRVISRGYFSAPPTTVSLVYIPNLFARSSSYSFHCI